MELARVKADFLEAREHIAGRLPASVPAKVRDRLIQMTELISGTVEMPR
jgi:hypothetical protein